MYSIDIKQNSQGGNVLKLGQMGSARCHRHRRPSHLQRIEWLLLWYPRPVGGLGILRALNDREIFSFNSVCDPLGINPVVLRKSLRDSQRSGRRLARRSPVKHVTAIL